MTQKRLELPNCPVGRNLNLQQENSIPYTQVSLTHRILLANSKALWPLNSNGTENRVKGVAGKRTFRSSTMSEEYGRILWTYIVEKISFPHDLESYCSERRGAEKIEEGEITGERKHVADHRGPYDDTAGDGAVS